MEFRSSSPPRRRGIAAAVRPSVRRRRGIELAAAAAAALISPGAGFIKSRPLSAPATYARRATRFNASMSGEIDRGGRSPDRPPGRSGSPGRGEPALSTATE